RGATLDFGTRTVHVTGDGQFSFGIGSATIESGSFIVDPGNDAAIHARGRGSSHSRSGGVTIRAFRQCSLHDRQCLGDDGCNLGDCGSRRCAANPLRLCEVDGDCSNGTCNHRRCSLNLDQRCDTDADCTADTCAEGFTCEGSGDEPVYCDENSDCDLGECSVGDGIIDLGGGIDGSSDKPAVIRLEAYGDISVHGDVDLHNTGNRAGGTISARSRKGDINLAGDIHCTGTPGGRVTLRSQQDTDIDGTIDCGGGLVDIATTATGITSSTRGVRVRAGRDIDLNGKIQVDGVSGAPFGGYLHLVAKRDLTISGEAEVSTSGANDHDLVSGFGGRQTYETRRNLTITGNPWLVSNGAAPNGSGGVVEFGVENDAFIEARIDARAGGFDAFDVAGGGFFLFANGSARIAEDTEIDLSGGSEGAGGRAIVDSAGDLLFEGMMQSRGNGEGRITVFDFIGCDITIGENAEIDNNALGGDNLFEVHERMTVEDGGLLRTNHGINQITYRTDNKKPRLDGNVSPKAVRILDSSLSPCGQE
ncbi:MAG TPA: hypothetical protein VEL28_14690, partial [Candidatus Binatia bacterium]|nr:hypothetical protein [Candidatus Binatia bacterium]